MRPYLLAVVGCAALALPARAADVRYRDDAALHAVQFLDADIGWAVGDEGVIWKTINGGDKWELQPSLTRASLRSLHMLTHLVGWVVGREELPSGGSGGVVLHTKDGGETWKRLLPDALPGLNSIRFADGGTGCLIGDASDQYPTGVFLTSDGGRKWQPVKGPRCTTWLAADFADASKGSLMGAWSRIGVLRDGNFGNSNVDQFGGRDLRGVLLRQPKSFAVGQGGLVLHSKSLGVGWDFNDTKLPADVLAVWDFHGVCGVGDKVWCVGRPGSAVLTSDDSGATWKVVKTGQPLPLNGVDFFDEKRGWAVGELGCVLHTQDGGQTWKVQKRGGQRAAVLCVHARGRDLPVETVAMLGAEQGLLTAAVRIAGPDPKSEAFAEAAQSHRFAAGHRLAGGAAAESLWQFPVPRHLALADQADLMKHWDGLHGDKAAQQMLRQLVLAIRIWRPDVVVTDHPDFALTRNSAGALVAEALHVAFQQAADPRAFPEQIAQLGLEAWRVSKVYGLWDKRDGSHVVVDPNGEGVRLEATFAEFAAEPAAILAAHVPGQRCYRLLGTTLKDIAGAKNLMDGAPLAAVGVSRRELPTLDEPNKALQAAVSAARKLQQLARNPDNGLASPQQIFSQLGTTLGKLPEERAGKAMFAIASEFARQGQWELARETFLTMLERYPAHPLCADACRWLILHNSSSEARRRHELGQFLMYGEKSGKAAAGGNLPKGDDIVQAGGIRNAAELLHWHQGSLLLGKKLAGFGSLHANDPTIQFCLQASRRTLNDHKGAQQFYSDYCGEHADGPWREAAAQELWYLHRTGLPPRPAVQCRFTDKKPFLDGKFDDDCWQTAKPLVLKNAVNAASDTVKDYPTEAKLSFDDKFLYVALHCKHPAGKSVPPMKERQRDADLRPFDRVSILLDLDRDYSTYFRLEVDQRGCVCEDCWGDKHWNPQWFVAVRSDEDGWRIEAAIPLHELTGERIVNGAAWAINVVRILPGRGVQSWSTPAGVDPRPEGMGLAIFQHERPAPKGP